MDKLIFSYHFTNLGVPESVKWIYGNVTYATKQNEIISQVTKRTADSIRHVYTLSPKVMSIELRVESMSDEDAQWLYEFMTEDMVFGEGIFWLEVENKLWLKSSGLSTGKMIGCSFLNNSIEGVFTPTPPECYDVTLPIEFTGWAT